MCIFVSWLSGLSPLVNWMKLLNFSFSSAPSLNLPKWTSRLVRILLSIGIDLWITKKALCKSIPMDPTFSVRIKQWRILRYKQQLFTLDSDGPSWQTLSCLLTYPSIPSCTCSFQRMRDEPGIHLGFCRKNNDSHFSLRKRRCSMQPIDRHAVAFFM